MPPPLECISPQCPVNRHRDLLVGYAMMEVYRVRIVIEDRNEAAELCRLTSSSQLYGVIKMEKRGLSVPPPEFMYCVKKDQPQIVDLSKNSEVILPLSGPSQPFHLFCNWVMTFALKLNDEYLFAGSDKYPVFDNYPDCDYSRDENFEGEKIPAAKIYFPDSLMNCSTCSLRTNLIWGESLFYNEPDDEKLVNSYPIKVYLDYGLLGYAVFLPICAKNLLKSWYFRKYSQFMVNLKSISKFMVVLADVAWWRSQSATPPVKVFFLC